MKNSDQPISPCVMQKIGDDSYRLSKGNDPKEWQVSVSGLTKREYFAGLAMQGVLASSHPYRARITADQVASEAIGIADALLKQLEQ